MKKPGSPTGSPRAPRIQTPLVQDRLSPVAVRYAAAPPPAARSDNIHPRRILPKVLEGREREFHSSTRAISFAPPAMRAFSAGGSAGDLAIQVNTPLPEPALQSLASNVGEPSVAANGRSEE